MRSGLWYGVAAYGLWGLFPIYWRLFPDVPPIQVLGHRIVWSFAVLAVLVAGSWHRRRGGCALSPRVVGYGALAGLLIGVNWFLFVYAVGAGFVVQVSLGYFITPLVNVSLGVVVLREPLSRLQWMAVVLAAGGVLHLTVAYGAVPWIALGLAGTFGTYGLVKKQTPLTSLDGLSLETAVLLGPALLLLGALHAQGSGAFLRAGGSGDALLLGGGLVTVVPLLLFASAVRRITLSAIGILQYIAPTMQFLLGVFAFREPFTRTQLLGFVAVWLAIGVFAVDGLRRRPR